MTPIEIAQSRGCDKALEMVLEWVSDRAYELAADQLGSSPDSEDELIELAERYDAEIWDAILTHRFGRPATQQTAHPNTRVNQKETWQTTHPNTCVICDELFSAPADPTCKPICNGCYADCIDDGEDD